MCGIAGYIGKRVINEPQVEKCLDLMGRRGPDASGVYRHCFNSEQNVCLLHTRLAIIDLDKRADQPFRYRSNVLVFNGELYNYIEQKRLLIQKGHSFKTTSDTEVFIHLLDKEGAGCLNACEGMWAFALYNEKKGSLILSRDRFGEKPLYLYEDDTGLYFGSEVKFLSTLAEKKFGINYNHLYRYLVNGYKSLYKTGETFFQKVRELPPASNYFVSRGHEPVQEKYWTPDVVQNKSMTYAEAVEGARSAVISSVKKRLRSDVPLAFCMSGGIDSNALISVAKNVFNYDVHGFTIVNTDERYDEQELVDHAVSELDIRHTPIPVRTDNFLENLRRLVLYHDAPVYTISYYAHWLLMECIKEHGYRISISGTAADELFTGYYDHHNMYLYEISANPDLYQTSLANWNKYIKNIVRNPYLQDPDVFVKIPDERRHIYLDAEKYSGFLKKRFFEPFFEETYCDGLLRNRMMNELFHESIPVILHEDDLNAMYYSIENRSPFLDRKLFDFCYSIPTRHLIREGYNKKVLRDAMAGIVPKKILDTRKKVGFNAPVLSFLDTTNSDIVSSLLDDGPVYHAIKKEEIEKILKKEKLSNSDSKFLFYFLGVKMFLEEFS